MVAGAVSCHRTSEAEARLIAIDSLVCTYPDSALTLLEAISPSKIEGVPEGRGRMIDGKGARHYDKLVYNDELRAYHALLTAQALYKAYIPATSDSIINRAWDYYKDHGSYDRRIRAMLYKGTTAEETGHPDTAMYWYKRTELESHPDDHYHRGYAQMTMGILYQKAFDIKGAIGHYRDAIASIDTLHKNLTIFCTQQLAQLYLDVKPDSARFYINQVSQYVQETNDSIYMLSNMVSKDMFWFYKGDFEKSKTVASTTIDIFGNRVPFTCWYHLIVSYIKLNKSDSADYYLSIMPAPASIQDSVFYYEMLQVMNQHEGRWKEALNYEKRSNNLSDKVLLNESSNSLLQAENQASIDSIQNKSNSKLAILLIVFLIALAIISLFYILNRRKRNELKHEIEELQRFSDNLQSLNNELSAENSELSKRHEDVLSELAYIKQQQNEESTQQDNNDSTKEMVSYLAESYRTILTQIRKDVGKGDDKKTLDDVIKKALTPNYFDYLHKYVDYAYSGLATEMTESGKLKDDEVNVVCMYLCRMPSSVIRVYTGLSSIQSVTRQRNQISTKYFGNKEKLESLLTSNMI